MRASGGRPVVVRHRREGAPPEGAPYQADLTSPEAVRTLLARVGADEGSPCALVHLLPLAPGLPGADLTLEDWRERARREVKALFYLSQAAVGNLRAPTPGGRTWLVAALASDTWPEHGGVAGFLGTAAREWPEVTCKAVDFAPPVAPTEVAERLLSEMAAGDSRVRVRYEAERRLQPSADLRALDEALPAALTPDSDWVFLLTGGARGITAEVALELAERYQPTLVLLGRSAPPAEESAATAGLATPSELKLALLEEIQGSGPAVGVREVETAYRRLLQDREMRENLAALRQTGARVSYQQVDVRDETALAELIRKIEAEHGRLDVVIHGAGVIEDKLIADKQPASFDRVFDTKTDGAFLLSRLLNPDTLRCLILFTSVAGPLGNPGQSDYAAANEVLAELAAHLDRAWPARVVALHWGPWARRGMVTAELEAALAQQGLALIAPEAGRALCVRELTHGAKGEPRVVLAAGPAVEAWGAAAPGPRPSARTLVPRPEEDGRELPLLHRANVARRGADELELVRVLDPAYDLYLDHHRLGGRAVLPMTFALELMAETAKALVPGREVTQVRDLHVLRGIVLDGTSARVRVRARREGGPDPDGVTTVTVELAETERNGHANYRMNLELRESFPDPPRVPRAGELEPFEMPVAEIYRRYLFHGPLLQGLVAIEGLGLGGASGVITSSSPQELLADAPPGEWVLDPMRFDSALQLGYVWALRQWGVSSLPARFASCRLFAPTGSGQVRCLMTGSSHNGGLAQRADMSMVDLQGRVLMLIEGFEAYGSKTLNLRADERR